MDSAERSELDAFRPSELRQISRKEYGEMLDAGLFDGESIELLRGMLVPMSPEGGHHALVVEWFTKHLIRKLPDEFRVRSGLPFVTSDSEPRPDLYVGPAPSLLRLEHPATALLLIEVSKGSLRKDRRFKTSIYSEAGVPEYWIVNVTSETEVEVEVYTEPTRKGYAKKVTYRIGDVLRPLQVPIEFAVSDIPHS